jgi:hypothetical protein
MKMMFSAIALGIGAVYFFTKNRKVDFEVEIEPRKDRMSEADERWLAAGAE